MYGIWLLLLLSILGQSNCLSQYDLIDITQEKPLAEEDPSYKQMLSNNYLHKKDVFMSRGWGAGGMPFSVLYMHPQQQQQQQPPPRAEQLTAEMLPLDTAPSNPHKHIAVRTNAIPGTLLPSRRQYSIIPQLFVSYGWGPLGK